jgi:hypothetical protein
MKKKKKKQQLPREDPEIIASREAADYPDHSKAGAVVSRWQVAR